MAHEHWVLPTSAYPIASANDTVSGLLSGGVSRVLRPIDSSLHALAPLNLATRTKRAVPRPTEQIGYALADFVRLCGVCLQPLEGQIAAFEPARVGRPRWERGAKRAKAACLREICRFPALSDGIPRVVCLQVFAPRRARCPRNTGDFGSKRLAYAHLLRNSGQAP